MKREIFLAVWSIWCVELVSNVHQAVSPEHCENQLTTISLLGLDGINLTSDCQSCSGPILAEGMFFFCATCCRSAQIFLALIR